MCCAAGEGANVSVRLVALAADCGGNGWRGMNTDGMGRTAFGRVVYRRAVTSRGAVVGALMLAALTGNCVPTGRKDQTGVAGTALTPATLGVVALDVGEEVPASSDVDVAANVPC
jgi:hypothetical protein